MRGFEILGALVIGVALAGSAAAQSALEGPLAAPDAAPAAKSKPAKSTHSKKKKVAHSDASPAASASGIPSQSPQPVAHAGRDVPADPLSFGMKWSGSNDDARETRTQNYSGDAEGTGAEVGMKLHF